MLIYLLPQFTSFQPIKAAQAPMPYVVPWQMNKIFFIATLLLLYNKLFSAVNRNLDYIFLFVFENVIGFFDF